MDAPALLQLVTDLGAMGFILWLAHRLTTVTIPSLTQAYADDAAKQREHFTTALREQRDAFTQFHEREHAAHETRLRAVMDKCLDGKVRD